MGSTRPLVAIVDDEDGVRRALSRLLRASALDVASYASGAEFLESLELNRPDCVVLDIQMAQLSGTDVQRQLGRAQIALPVIIITAFDEPGVREQCMADGAFAFLRKPLRGNVLLDAIGRAVGRQL